MGEISSDNNGTSEIAPVSLRLLLSCDWMKRLIRTLFIKNPSSTTDVMLYEQAQRRRVLATMLRVIVVAGVALFLVNVYIHAWNIAIALLTMSFFCVPAFWLNSRGHYILSASLTLTVILCVADYNLYATGGLQDSGMLVYPLIIIVGSLFFGKRAIPILTLASVGSLAVLAYLEIKGAFLPARVETTPAFVFLQGVLLMASSALVWVILHNTERNIARIRHAEEELLRTYHLTLEGLARVLEYRDSETEGHSRRVVDLSVRLAREMDCSQEEIGHIQRGALIHDIGKMAIPDYILSKPGPLDDVEKKIMEKRRFTQGRCSNRFHFSAGLHYFILSSREVGWVRISAGTQR